jgi:hypothetical protein
MVNACPDGISWTSPTRRRYLTSPTRLPADTTFARQANADDEDDGPVLLRDAGLDYLCPVTTNIAWPGSLREAS